ncbi:MAG: ATP synthase subunit I [Clostridia bacterium]|nr:ATP synthase subunit I [Clostridia bacterium]
MRLDDTVRREIRLVSLWMLGLSLLMELAFALFGKWTPEVLWGNLAGAAAAIGNFTLMCITIQKAVGQPESAIRNRVRASQQLRLIGQGAVAAAGFLLPFLNPWATLLPLLFPSLCMRLRPLWDKSLREEPDPDKLIPLEDEPAEAEDPTPPGSVKELIYTVLKEDRQSADREDEARGGEKDD